MQRGTRTPFHLLAQVPGALPRAGDTHGMKNLRIPHRLQWKEHEAREPDSQREQRNSVFL